MVIGWFTRIFVVLALLVVGGYDSVTLAAGHLSAKDDANNAAGDAASYLKLNNQTATLAGALATARADLSHGETIAPEQFHVNTDGSVTLTVHRVVGRTLVAHHLGFLKDQIAFDETVTGTPLQP